MLKIISIMLFALCLNAVSLQEQTLTIEKVKGNQAIINIGNLKIGQSGVVVHKFRNKKTIILTSATVISSRDDKSIIEFLPNKILEQKSIANTNIKPTNGDDFILNHMYNVSLLITPNYESYLVIKQNNKNNFIDSELFAGYLRINNNPTPNKEDFMKFTLENNISTIYIVIQNKVYILDALTFKIIATHKLDIKEKKIQVPFYTKVQDISKGIFNFTGDNKIKNYNTYYKQLIGVK